MEARHGTLSIADVLERIEQIATRFGCTRCDDHNLPSSLIDAVNPEETKENILYARALNSEVCAPLSTEFGAVLTRHAKHQMELLNALAQPFASNQYRLLIIDSIMNCFRVDYSGRGELSERQQKLNQFLSRLAHMAEGLLANS